MFHETDPKYNQVEQDARKLADSLSQFMKEGSEEQGDAMSNKTKELFNDTKYKMQNAKQYAQKTGKEVDRYAHEHVWTTVGVAAGIGAILGLALGKLVKK